MITTYAGKAIESIQYNRTGGTICNVAYYSAIIWGGIDDVKSTTYKANCIIGAI
jgi:hypothetical protein